jgi:hypothetical protein
MFYAYSGMCVYMFVAYSFHRKKSVSVLFVSVTKTQLLLFNSDSANEHQFKRNNYCFVKITSKIKILAICNNTQRKYELIVTMAINFTAVANYLPVNCIR